jgi:AsmA protein
MPVQRTRRRQFVVGLLLALLLAIVVPPFVNANLFRARLARSVSNALGRNVAMGDVNIRLLPIPGFQIQNFVIMDDPSFSAEPMLRADSVTARLRLTSLWRGRLEIARLSFTDPSLNLVRNAEGRWNIEGLLAHASQVSAAPTGKKKPEARLRFPYIEADTGRINFKVQQDKLAHVLVDADFALWQESDNQWNMRLEARPTRTDANLGDTGTLRIEGSFQRADTIENTPMKLSFDWQKAQLGQLTALIYGRDRGWRGDVRISGTLEGMPRQFEAKASVQVSDLRRYDIASEDSVYLTAQCVADHSSVPGTDATGFRNSFQCHTPLGAGGLELRAFGEYWWHAPDYLGIRANSVPVAALAQVYRHAKRDVPRDLTGSGVLNAYFSRVNDPDSQHPRWIGQGAMTDVHLSSAQLAQDFSASMARFGFSHVEQMPEGPNSGGLSPRLKAAKPARLPAPDANVFTVDPFSADLGTKVLVISGANSPQGLQLNIKGDADLKRLTETAQMFGLQLPPATTPAGIVNVDYQITGHWAGFAAPAITGTVRPEGRSAIATETASNQQHAKTTKPRQ